MFTCFSKYLMQSYALNKWARPKFSGRKNNLEMKDQLCFERPCYPICRLLCLVTASSSTFAESRLETSQSELLAAWAWLRSSGSVLLFTDDGHPRPPSTHGKGGIYWDRTTFSKLSFKKLFWVFFCQFLSWDFMKETTLFCPSSYSWKKHFSRNSHQ